MAFKFKGFTVSKSNVAPTGGKKKQKKQSGHVRSSKYLCQSATDELIFLFLAFL